MFFVASICYIQREDIYSSHISYKISIICRVFSVKFSGDGTYVLSGSDDTNVRIWKAKASEQLGVVCALLTCLHNITGLQYRFVAIELFFFFEQLLPREKHKHAYMNALKERYKHLPEEQRIDRYVVDHVFKTCVCVIYMGMSICMAG
jgi:hypothetical protein